MPLVHGKSQKAFEKNVKTEMEAHPGKEHRAQNLAVAYAIKRKAQHHKAMGGDAAMEESGEHMCKGGGCEHPSHKMAQGSYASDAHAAAMSKRDRAIHAFKGGFIGSHESPENPEVDGDLMPEAHKHLELEEEHVSHPDSHDSHAEHAVMNQEGEEDQSAGDMDEIHPMVMKIMMGRAKGYSEGGQVANEDQGESADEPDKMAKWKPNEFDDLALRDDLEFDSTGANEGDELGDEVEDHDRHDIVERIMKSRSKRDRMAVPGEGSSYGRGK